MKKIKLKKGHGIKKMSVGKEIELSSVHIGKGLFVMRQSIARDVERFSKMSLNKKEVKFLKKIGYLIGGL